MSWIRLAAVSKTYERTPVLRDVHLRLRAGDKVGLIGRNGTGKTTVLNLMLGREAPDTGTVDVSGDTTIGYFSQFSELGGDTSISEQLDALFADVHAVEDELATVAAELDGSGEIGPQTGLLTRQAELFERMANLEGWTYHNRIDTVLTTLGFSAEHRNLPVSQLSGGWRNRAALARIVLQEPDILLMDEPTNYLDIDGLRWLESWFQQFRGALVVVSHDRQFLDAVSDRIIEIENYHLHEYDGNYSEYVRKKELRLKSLHRQFLHEEELLAYEREALKTRRELARNPTTSLRRRLATIKKGAPPRPVDQIVTSVYAGLYVSNDLCRVENLTKGYGDGPLFTDLSFDVRRADRLAVVGPNGCGKSTLIEVLTGGLAPDSGRVVWSKGIRFSYFNEVFANLDRADTVSHAINAAPGSLAFDAPRKKVNQFLGLFQFSELDLQQRIGVLSGGQQARIALAQCLLSGAAVVILDEPTNHLDITSTQVMERALAHFPGAVIAVSHDRYFIEHTCDRVLAFEGEGMVRERPVTLS